MAWRSCVCVCVCVCVRALTHAHLYAGVAVTAHTMAVQSGAAMEGW